MGLSFVSNGASTSRADVTRLHKSATRRRASQHRSPLAGNHLQSHSRARSYADSPVMARCPSIHSPRQAKRKVQGVAGGAACLRKPARGKRKNTRAGGCHHHRNCATSLPYLVRGLLRCEYLGSRLRWKGPNSRNYSRGFWCQSQAERCNDLTVDSGNPTQLSTLATPGVVAARSWAQVCATGVCSCGESRCRDPCEIREACVEAEVCRWGRADGVPRRSPEWRPGVWARSVP